MGSVKKTQYIRLSLLFGSGLNLSKGFLSLSIVLYEFHELVVSEKVPFTAPWLISLLCVQVSSIYLLLLGYIYSNEEGNDRDIKLSMFSFVLNTTAFVLRLVINLGFEGFFPLGIENI